nr:HpsJ family protein [Synechococcus sp. CCY 0621]
MYGAWAWTSDWRHPTCSLCSSVTSSPTPAISPNPTLARLLAPLSIVLLVVFLAAVLTTALPPRLLDPQWQLQAIAVLVNSASLALIGALLLPLAVWVDADNQRLRARRNACRRWALAAAIGFLLLIPLQGYAGWRAYSTITGSRQQQISQSTQRLDDLRQTIRSATSHQELQAGVQKLFGPNAGLSPAELGTPMSELRNMLLARAEQASRQLMQQVEAQAAIKPDQLLKETLRIAISALAYAVGFAFLAGVLPRGSGAAAPPRRGVDEDYFRQLAE